MPPSSVKLPCADLDASELIKVQAEVSRADKRTIVTALGLDAGTHALIIQSAYKNIAAFIRTHGLESYSSTVDDATRTERIINFIRDGTDTCATGQAAAHAKSGGSKSRKRAAT